MSEKRQGYPSDRKYTREHEWVRLEGGVGIIGITEYAQSELGDVVFVDLPEKGRALAAGEELGTIESVKAVSEIYAPVSGEVVEVNEALRDHPEKVNGDPYGDGWLVKVRVGDRPEVDGLLSSEAYRSHVEEGE
ncbi:MAG TPA: glycine cleavage system protein GcvH [Candidatus Polarisedimenticolia bacterium]|jgi:glycine cleavage system H protein|nr:glycine cleavage system protein GcvH [Candidatus Polarisedimenticolia bacterium]